jgi:hypothetical protein
MDGIPADDRDVYERLSGGLMSYVEAGKRLGISPQSVVHRIKRLGLFRPRFKTVPGSTIPDDIGTLSYFAGLFDGEGCMVRTNVGRKNRKPTFRLAVTMTHPGVLEWVASKFGGRVYPRHYTFRDTWKSRPQYAWVMTRSADVLAVLESIVPFMIVRRDDAKRLIDEIRVGLDAQENRNL